MRDIEDGVATNISFLLVFSLTDLLLVASVAVL